MPSTRELRYKIAQTLADFQRKQAPSTHNSKEGGIQTPISPGSLISLISHTKSN